MADARARAIFDADDSQLRAAYLRADKGLMMMQSRFGAVKSFLIGMAPVAGVIAGVKKIGDVVEAGGALADESASTGLATEEILKMRKELKAGGSDAAALAPAMQKMQKSLVSGGANEYLTKLGFNLQSLLKKSPAEQFHEIGKAIGSMRDPAERTAAAMAVFGKTGANLLPVFQDQSFGDVKLRKGDQLLANDAALFDDFGDKLESLKPHFESFFVGMADKIIPVFRPLLDQIEKMDFASMGQSFADPIAQAIQLFSDGKLGTVMGDMFVIAGARLVNVLFTGIAAVGAALIGYGMLFSAKLYDGLASLLQSLRLSGASSVAKTVSTTAHKFSDRTLDAAAGMTTTRQGVFNVDQMQANMDKVMDANFAKMQATAATSLANAKPSQGTQAVDEYDKAPVVSALQRIGGASGSGGGMENLMRDSVSVSRQSMALLQGIHDSLSSSGTQKYAVLM